MQTAAAVENGKGNVRGNEIATEIRWAPAGRGRLMRQYTGCGTALAGAWRCDDGSPDNGARGVDRFSAPMPSRRPARRMPDYRCVNGSLMVLRCAQPVVHPQRELQQLLHDADWLRVLRGRLHLAVPIELLLGLCNR